MRIVETEFLANLGNDHGFIIKEYISWEGVPLDSFSVGCCSWFRFSPAVYTEDFTNVKCRTGTNIERKMVLLCLVGRAGSVWWVERVLI